MSVTEEAAPRQERGSALVIATLITVILCLPGISCLMMAQTENTIAENERNAAMALYVAEAGARLAVNWFNDPSSTGYLVPTTAQVDRTKRLLDHDGNPATARVLAAAGDAAKPLYKDAALTSSPVFDRPYRSALADTFFGIQTGTDPDPTFAASGPDLIVNDAHLATINDALFPSFPGPNLRARIARIEIYGPPVVNAGGVPTRMGIATVRVVGGVFMYPGTADERQIATRVVKAVVNEIPVPGPVGPLQSCNDLGYSGSFEVHWGTGSSQASATLPNSMDTKISSGMPYAANDPFSYISGATTLASWAAARNGVAIDDPWFKYVAGGPLTGGYNPSMVNPGDPQPWPWASATPTDQDHSNIFQNTPMNCPTFDYALWKSIAQSGNRGHYYYKWDSGTSFKLDGVGTAVSFINATGGRTGIFFFDTTTSSVPFGTWTDPQGTTPGTTNLTPAISIGSADGWLGAQGFIFLNARSFATTGAGGMGSTRWIIPPGEPGDGSGFVNFNYPTAAGSLAGPWEISTAAIPEAVEAPSGSGNWYCTDHTTCTALSRVASATPVKDNYGLPFTATVVMDGVMYTSGTFTSSGNAVYFGSLVAQQGVIDGTGTPGLYFDESLIKGNWPRKGMNLPRVVVTSWETEL
ncbi:MAG: hypothetical protein HY510_06430 [Acidobacteria bacterium]|nr:hypothetical protein [Acidobacteriota bacterium]